MIQLTSNIPVPNITRIRLRRPQIDDVAGILRAEVEVGGAAGRIYTVLQLEVRNGGPCNGVQAAPAPVRFDDFVQGFTLAGDAPGVATAYDDAVGAFVGPTMNARLDGLETWAIGLGLLPAGTVS